MQADNAGTSVIQVLAEKRFPRKFNIYPILVRGINRRLCMDKLETQAKPYCGQKFNTIIHYSNYNKKIQKIEIELPTSSLVQPKIISQKRGHKRVHEGDITLEKLVQIAIAKRNELLGVNLHDCVLSVIGSYKSLGINLTIERVSIEEQLESGHLQILEDGQILKL
jgi:ribosomal protein L11